jgi:hypothetical protein
MLSFFAAITPRRRQFIRSLSLCFRHYSYRNNVPYASVATILSQCRVLRNLTLQGDLRALETWRLNIFTSRNYKHLGQLNVQKLTLVEWHRYGRPSFGDTYTFYDGTTAAAVSDPELGPPTSSTERKARIRFLETLYIGLNAALTDVRSTTFPPTSNLGEVLALSKLDVVGEGRSGPDRKPNVSSRTRQQVKNEPYLSELGVMPLYQPNFAKYMVDGNFLLFTHRIMHARTVDADCIEFELARPGIYNSSAGWISLDDIVLAPPVCLKKHIRAIITFYNRRLYRLEQIDKAVPEAGLEFQNAKKKHTEAVSLLPDPRLIIKALRQAGGYSIKTGSRERRELEVISERLSNCLQRLASFEE